MNDTPKKLTMTVPEAGALLGLNSDDAAYRAAKAGQIPTIKLGRYLKVPIAALEQMLDAAKPNAN